MDTCIAPYYAMNPLLERSDMARDSKGITQFYLPSTYEPYLVFIAKALSQLQVSYVSKND